MSSFPTFFKNPFIESVKDLYLSVDIFKKITYADYAVVPLSKINRRLHTVKQTRVIGADTRYLSLIHI